MQTSNYNNLSSKLKRQIGEQTKEQGYKAPKKKIDFGKCTNHKIKRKKVVQSIKIKFARRKEKHDADCRNEET